MLSYDYTSEARISFGLYNIATSTSEWMKSFSTFSSSYSVSSFDYSSTANKSLFSIDTSIRGDIIIYIVDH